MFSTKGVSSAGPGAVCAVLPKGMCLARTVYNGLSVLEALRLSCRSPTERRDRPTSESPCGTEAFQSQFTTTLE